MCQDESEREKRREKSVRNLLFSLFYALKLYRSTCVFFLERRKFLLFTTTLSLPLFIDYLWKPMNVTDRLSDVH